MISIYVTLVFNLNVYWITCCFKLDFVNASDDITVRYFVLNTVYWVIMHMFFILNVTAFE